MVQIWDAVETDVAVAASKLLLFTMFFARYLNCRGTLNFNTTRLKYAHIQEANMRLYKVSLPLLRPLFKHSSDTAPTLSDISSRIMRNWSHHARGSSLQFLAGNGGSSSGRASSSASAAAAAITTTDHTTRYQIGRRTSSSDETIAYSIELATGGYCGSKEGKTGIERVKEMNSDEFEARPFGEVLVTKTVMVDEERRSDDKNLDFMV